ncbi:MAG: hypothetical protein JO332_07645 [Planctomycetaceae bacterium]|nr:hypothetical protein [Planctomycetaceae bacterium]
MSPGRIPLWLKVGWTLWVAVWVPLYWRQYGPSNFLWFCDIGNFVITAALWKESALLFSWQACSVLGVQLLFTIDLVVRALFGFHPIHGTEYMFNDDGSNIPLGMRLLSLFHVATPPVLLWALKRLGYDRRGLPCQIATAWIVLPVCWFGWSEKVNLNWVWGPFNQPQYVIRPAWLFLIVCMLAYPILLYLPTHLLLSRLFRRPVSAQPL